MTQPTLSEVTTQSDAHPHEPLLTPLALAGQLGVPVKTLAEWRSRNIGPKYLKVGRHVRYRQRDVDRWLVEHEQTPSS